MEWSLVIVPVIAGGVGYAVGRWWVLAPVVLLVALAMLPAALNRESLRGHDGDAFGLYAFLVGLYGLLIVAGATIGVLIRLYTARSSEQDVVRSHGDT